MKKENQVTQPPAEILRQTMMYLIENLLTRSMGEIEQVRKKLYEQDEPEPLSLALSVKMSPNEYPSVEVKLTYSERHSDKLATTCENPAQGKLAV
jgi:hypothetical protein